MCLEHGQHCARQFLYHHLLWHMYRSYIVDPLMKFLSVYTNSKNLNNRLRTGRDTVKKGLDGAGAALQQAITFKLPQPGQAFHDGA